MDTQQESTKQYYEFDCGCKFEIADERIKECDGLPSIKIDWYNIPFDCPKTWALYKSGMTKGVFQLENSLGQDWSKQIAPESIDEIAALISLIRPGSLRAFMDDSEGNKKCMTQHYAERKHGQSQATNVIECLKPILGETYFVLCFQEQSMRIAMDIAGYNEEEADILRKAIGKKDAELMASLKDSFLEGCKKVGKVNEAEAEEIFGWIRESQRYSFNASHAVGYGELGYWTAYFKAHFPVHFFCSWIHGATEKQKPKYEIRDLLFDCQAHNIDVHGPSIVRFYGGNTSFHNNHITIGARHVAKVGDSSLDAMMNDILELSQTVGVPISEWTWIEILVILCDRVRNDMLNNLIAVGAFDHLNISRRRMLYELQMWNKLTGKYEKPYIKENFKSDDSLLDLFKMLCYANKLEKPISSKRRIETINELTEQLENPAFSMADDIRWIAKKEHALIGKSISMHNTESYNIATNTTCREFADGKNAQTITIMGEIQSFREYDGKNNNKGRKMGAMSLEDNTGRINALCFFDLYEEYKEEFIEGNVIAVKVKRSHDGKAIIESFLK